MKGECSCWIPYPNKYMKKADGKWRCVDEYECVKDRQRGAIQMENGCYRIVNSKTKCRKKEST